MVNKGQLLETTIGDCGTLFRVEDAINDKTFHAGSKGFLSFIMGPDCNCPNVVFHKVVTIRRGKTGKPRINQNMILAPIFHLPGVPLSFTIPEDVERKYFVNIGLTPDDTMDVMSKDQDDKDARLLFLGQLYARSSFAKELDTVIYPGDHDVTKAVGVTPGSKIKIWPTGKASMVRKFQNEIEAFFSSGEHAVIDDYFWEYERREHLLKRLHEIEASLTIPKLEYQRKVGETMLDALKYLDDKLKTKDAEKLDNLDDLKDSISNTKEAVKNSIKITKRIINSRLTTISKNRKLLKL